MRDVCRGDGAPCWRQSISVVAGFLGSTSKCVPACSEIQCIADSRKFPAVKAKNALFMIRWLSKAFLSAIYDLNDTGDVSPARS